MAMKSFGSVPTVTVRRILGIQARKPGNFQRCIGAALKDGTHASAPVGMGGRNNKDWQGKFYDAAKGCGGSTRSGSVNIKKPRPA